jgi:hypothetical protein
MNIIKASVLIPKLKERVGEGYVYGATGQICSIALLKSKERQYGEAMGNGYYQLNGDYTRGKCAKWLFPKPVRVQDCSNLFQDLRRKCGQLVASASAHMLYGQCAIKGTIDKMPKIAGVGLFVWDTRKKRMRHVGMYIGDGICIESAGATLGVIKHSVSKSWTHWGLFDWLEYDILADGTPIPPPVGDGGDSDEPQVPNFKRVLKFTIPNMQGEDIRIMQLQLKKKGYGKNFIDKYLGIFGEKTDDAICDFQRVVGLPMTGIVDEKLWELLFEEHNYKIYKVVAGDTLSGIGKKLGVNWRTQIAGKTSDGEVINPTIKASDGYMIHGGQEIRILIK